MQTTPRTHPSAGRRSKMAALAVAVAAATLLVPGSGRAAVSHTDVAIPMSDGVVLYADINLPADTGNYPVVLEMTPYDRTLLGTGYVASGYAQVNVDIRGTGASGGWLCLFCDREQQDVYEVVEWVGTQSWSNGNVGMIGGSYDAITQMLGAAKQPPHLKAIVPVEPFADAYRDIVWHNGIFDLNFMTQWTVLQAGLSTTGIKPDPAQLNKIYNYLAVTTRQYPFDGPFYQERSVYTKYDRIKVPTLFLTGWFDGFSRGTIKDFQGIASTDKKLIVNGGTHKGTGGVFDPLTPYSDDGRPGPANPELAWLDHYVKGDTSVDTGPTVVYYDLGTKSWNSAPSWPPPTASLQRLYLSGATSGSATSLNDGSLTAERPTGTATASDSYIYDPATGLAESLAKWGTVAASPHVRLDQRIDETRELTYTTPVTASPITLAGPVELHFWASTDATDTDFIVKVTDVFEDGSSQLITAGYMKASHRAWDSMRYVPGEPWITNTSASLVGPSADEYRIDVWGVSNTILPGHRLRIDLMSADVPSHEPSTLPARNTIYHDPAHSSELIYTAA